MIKQGNNIVPGHLNAQEYKGSGFYEFIPSTLDTPPFLIATEKPIIPDKLLHLDTIRKITKFDIRDLVGNNDKGRSAAKAYLGSSGSGKSMQINYLSLKLFDLGYLIIHVKELNSLEEFSAFLSRLEQEKAEDLLPLKLAVIMNEFEKNICEDTPDSTILDMLSRNYATRTIFLLSSNQSYVGAYLDNRPGRILLKSEFTDVKHEDAINYFKLFLNKEEALNEAISSSILGKRNIKTNLDSLNSLVSHINDLSKEEVEDMLINRDFSAYVKRFNVMFEDISEELLFEIEVFEDVDFSISLFSGILTSNTEGYTGCISGYFTEDAKLRCGFTGLDKGSQLYFTESKLIKREDYIYASGKTDFETDLKTYYFKLKILNRTERSNSHLSMKNLLHENK